MIISKKTLSHIMTWAEESLDYWQNIISYNFINSWCDNERCSFCKYATKLKKKILYYGAESDSVNIKKIRLFFSIKTKRSEREKRHAS